MVFSFEKPILIKTSRHCFWIKRSHVKRIDADDYAVDIRMSWLSPFHYRVYPGREETVEILFDYLVELLIEPPK